MTVIHTIPVPVKATGYADYAKAIADALAGTVLNVAITSDIAVLNVNIATCLATLNVNLTGSTIMMPVDIQAQLANININIAAQTANVNINIAAQAGDVTINITAQNVGISLMPEYQAIAGQSVRIIVAGTALAFGSRLDGLGYTVPVGKTLYITCFQATNDCIGADATFANRVQGFFADIWNTSLGTQLAILSGSWGDGITFTPPLVVPAGNIICTRIWNFGSAVNSVGNNVLGYLK